MKRILSIVLSFAMLMSLASCGKSSDTKATASEKHSEDQVQEDIKSDNETVALQEKESTGTSDAQPEITNEEGTDEASINTDNNGTSAPGYTSTDSFWNGYDFDLEGYLYANGAKWVKKGYDHADNTGFHESDTDVMFYMAYFDNTYWMMTIGQGSVVFDYRGYKVDGETWYGPYYVAGQRSTDQLKITTNGYNTYCTDTMISTLDDMLYMTICHPDSDNPFKYSENNGILYSVESTRKDIPAGATHR